MAADRTPVIACVAVGANLGDACQTVLATFESLAQLPHTVMMARSRLYRTAPHEAQGPDFVNAVVQISTRLTAPSLLCALQSLETQAGRLRPYLNAPRTLDLDLLVYGQAMIFSPQLTVPHPRLRDRAFVLYPLADVCPDLVKNEDWIRVTGQPIEVLPDAAS